jgi:methylmalonyl-CoA mutase N-terminal domain/subunit
MRPIEKAIQSWRKHILEPTLAKFPERKDLFKSTSGLKRERVYLPPDPTPDYLENLGFPGEYPFTRGVQPTMYRGRLWTMRQYAGYASAEATNERFKYLLDQGQTGLSVAFDLPTQIGYDADDAIAEGEVGKVGVSISSLEDMLRLLDGIPLDKVSTSMTINAPAAILLAMYIAAARTQGVDPRILRGTIQNDILKEYVARGTYIFPPSHSMRLITDIFQYCREQIPRWNTISVSGYHIREAGATAVQELAFTLSNAIAYLQAAIDVGLDIDEVAPQIAFFFNAHNDFLEEIAKFRAARRLWANLMRHRFGSKDPRSWRLRFHTQTAGSTLTAQQPANNIVRVTLQALAAILGGTQSLHTNSMDEALGLPSEHAVQVALRTQQILAMESGVADSIDPLAGSFAIEQMTDEIERAANAYIHRIDEMGGALSAVDSGFMQREIHEAAYQSQQTIENGDSTVVGVNIYASEDSPNIQPLIIDSQIEDQQRRALKQLRKRRDQGKVDHALDEIRGAAESDRNLMPLLITSVESDATLGEICGALRAVWGEHRPSTTFL